MTNKTEKVFQHLQKHKSGITSWQAIDNYGATRLSSIIFNLKKRGHNIICVKEEGVDRYGNVSRYGRYVLMTRKTIFDIMKEKSNG